MGTAYEVICDDTDRANWLELRRTGIGASEMAAILGESTWGSALSIYTGKVHDTTDDLADVEAVEWGKRLEQTILEAYRERTGRHAERSGQLLRSLKYPWAMCTLDGLTWENEPPGWPLEIKNASEWKKGDWEEGPPRPYLIQVYHQMLVTDEPKATVACLLGGNRLVWQDVERDESEVRRIVHAGEEFWNRVQRRIPPEPDGSDASGRALARLYPADDGSIVELEGDYADILDELEAAKADQKEAEERRTELEQRLKARIGTAATAFVGRWVVTYKKQSRAEHVVKASEFRVLRPKQRKDGAA